MSKRVNVKKLASVAKTAEATTKATAKVVLLIPSKEMKTPILDTRGFMAMKDRRRRPRGSVKPLDLP